MGSFTNDVTENLGTPPVTHCTLVSRKAFHPFKEKNRKLKVAIFSNFNMLSGVHFIKSKCQFINILNATFFGVFSVQYTKIIIKDCKLLYVGF